MKTSLKSKLQLLAICSLIGLLSSVYWFFDLFNHFRLHAVLASVVLLTAAVFYNRKYAPFAGALLVVNLILFSIPLYQSRGISSLQAQDGALKIVSANVYTANDQYEKAINILTQDTPDIIAFTEVDAPWAGNLERLKGAYPHAIAHPRSDNFGMAVYSKQPFKGEFRMIGEYELPLAVLDFENFRLVVAHPVPPISDAYARQNRLYLEAIAALARDADRPVIVAGDLNSTIWGGAMQPLFEAGLKRINPWGVAYTWPSYMPLLALQIDHFLAKGIRQADFKVLPGIGSDHYPIQTVVNLL